MKKGMILLIVAIPFTGVLACTCLIVFALSGPADLVGTEKGSNPSQEHSQTANPLSKTSWRNSKP